MGLAPSLGLFELDVPSLRMGERELMLGLRLGRGEGGSLGLAVPLGPGDGDACCSSIIQVIAPYFRLVGSETK